MRTLSITMICVLSLATAAYADSEMVETTTTTAAADPADCWVELYDEPTLKGDVVKLQGPLSQPKLADLEYKNGENLNDDVRGVRTGPTARVELFEKASFEGSVHRVYEGSSEKLGSEDASSVKISCIDPLPAVSAAPNPADCWVELYDEPTLKGDNVKIQGPTQTELAKLEYKNGENLNDDVRGVRTGPTARVELYEKGDFGGKTHRVFPGSSESLSSEDASSVKVTCE